MSVRALRTHLVPLLSECLFAPCDPTLILRNATVGSEGSCNLLWANRGCCSHALIEQGELCICVIFRATLAASGGCVVFIRVDWINCGGRIAEGNVGLIQEINNPRHTFVHLLLLCSGGRFIDLLLIAVSSNSFLRNLALSHLFTSSSQSNARAVTGVRVRGGSRI